MAVATDRIFWVNKSQMLQYRPAKNIVKTVFETGGMFNYVIDGNFQESAWREDATLKRWEGNAAYARKNSRLEGNKYDLELTGYSTTLGNAGVLRARPFWLDKELRCRLTPYIDCEDAVDNANKANPQLYVEIACGNKFYDVANEQWQDAQVFNNILSIHHDIKFREYTFSRLNFIAAPPVPGYCTIRVFQPVNPDGYNLKGVRLAYFIIYDGTFWGFSGDLDQPTNTHESQNPKRYSDKEETTVILGGNYEGKLNIFGQRTSGSRVAGTMVVNNMTQYERYLTWGGLKFQEWHARERYDNFYKPTQVLTGTLRGSLDFGTVLEDTISQPGKYFMCTGFSLDDMRCTYQGEWVEIATDNQMGYLIDYSGNYAIDENGGKVINYGL